MDVIPLEKAQSILVQFGITKPSRSYERWVKEYGFDIKDFDEVLYESPYIFVIDWRAWLQEEVESIANILSLLGINIKIDLNEDGDIGYISNDKGEKEKIKYVPSEDDNFEDIIRSLQKLIGAKYAFRKSPNNDGNDTFVYSILPVEYWEALEIIDRELINSYFIAM